MQCGLFEVLKIETDVEEGWILEVDLEYPEELHISHSDYPLAVETNNIPEHWLSALSSILQTIHVT